MPVSGVPARRIPAFTARSPRRGAGAETGLLLDVVSDL
jgi:hypothetical protein